VNTVHKIIYFAITPEIAQRTWKKLNSKEKLDHSEIRGHSEICCCII